MVLVYQRMHYIECEVFDFFSYCFLMLFGNLDNGECDTLWPEAG